LLVLDIVSLIISFVEDTEALTALSQTCRSFNVAINCDKSGNLWRRLFRREVRRGGVRSEARSGATSEATSVHSFSSTIPTLFALHFAHRFTPLLNQVGVGNGNKTERFLGEELDWKELCRRGLGLR